MHLGGKPASRFAQDKAATRPVRPGNSSLAGLGTYPGTQEEALNPPPSLYLCWELGSEPHTPQTKPVTARLDDRGPGTRAFLAPTCFLPFNTFPSLPAPTNRASCFRGRRPQQKSSLSSTVFVVLLCNSSPAPLQRRPRPSNHQTTIISIALWEYPTSIDPPSQPDQPLL